MPTDFKPEARARIDATTRTIVEVRRGQIAAPSAPEAMHPVSIDEALAVQAAVTRELDEPVAGWKTALTPDKETLFAPIYRSTVYSSGVTIVSPPRPMRSVEIEIGFILGRDIMPSEGPFDEKSARSAISHFFVGIEILQLRFSGPDPLPRYLNLADNMGNGGYIVGDQTPLPAKIAPPQKIVAEADGKRFWDGPGVHANGNLFIPVIAMMNIVGRHLGGLKRGQFITAGNLCNPPFAIPDGGAIKVTTELGDVAIDIE